MNIRLNIDVTVASTFHGQNGNVGLDSFNDEQGDIGRQYPQEQLPIFADIVPRITLRRRSGSL